jgi:hypothetical protein
MHHHGMSAMQALNDQNTFQKYLELIAQFNLNTDSSKNTIDLDKDIKAIRQSLEK